MQGYGIFKTRVDNFFLFRKSGEVCSEVDVRDTGARASCAHQIPLKVVILN
jgi:hypothetical protein